MHTATDSAVQTHTLALFDRHTGFIGQVILGADLYHGTQCNTLYPGTIGVIHLKARQQIGSCTHNAAAECGRGHRLQGGICLYGGIVLRLHPHAAALGLQAAVGTRCIRLRRAVNNVHTGNLPDTGLKASHTLDLSRQQFVADKALGKGVTGTGFVADLSLDG